VTATQARSIHLSTAIAKMGTLSFPSYHKAITSVVNKNIGKSSARITFDA